MHAPSLVSYCLLSAASSHTDTNRGDEEIVKVLKQVYAMSQGLLREAELVSTFNRSVFLLYSYIASKLCGVHKFSQLCVIWFTANIPTPDGKLCRWLYCLNITKKCVDIFGSANKSGKIKNNG
jgi:hypothetical protein